jgi:hypothetical protein
VQEITATSFAFRIGVAADARERLRAMQVGSPVELQLVGRYLGAHGESPRCATRNRERERFCGQTATAS